MAERPVALPPVTGGEANASDTTDTSNSGLPYGLPKLLDGDGVDANQPRQAGIRDALFLLPAMRLRGNQGFQNPVGKGSILHRFLLRDGAFGGHESRNVRFGQTATSRDPVIRDG